MAKEFTVENFETEVLQSDLPVLVDFWAPWCGPCQMMGPIVEKLAGEYEGKMKIGKLNVDEASSQPLAEKYGIRGIPAFKVFQNGEVVGDFVGARGEADLKAELDKYL